MIKKGKKIIILFFLMTTLIFSVEELSIKDLIDIYKKNSSLSKIIIKQEIKTHLNKTGILLKNWKEFKIEIKPVYEKNYKTNEESKNFELSLDYNGFYYLSNSSLENIKLLENNIGIIKSIDHLFGMEKNYNKNMLEIDKKIETLDNKNNLNNSIKKIIDLYFEVILSEKEMEYKEGYITFLNENFKVLEQKTKIRKNLIFEKEYISILLQEEKDNLTEINNKIDLNRKIIGNLIGKEIKKTIKFNDRYDIKIKELDTINDIIKLKNLEISRLNQKIKYINKKSIGDITFNINYNIDAEIINSEIKYTKIFNQRRTEKKILIKEKEILEIEKNDEINNYKINVKKIKNDISYLDKIVQRNKKRLKLLKRKLKFSKSIFENRSMDLMEYLEIKNEYEKLKVEYIKSKFDLEKMKFTINYTL